MAECRNCVHLKRYSPLSRDFDSYKVDELSLDLGVTCRRNPVKLSLVGRVRCMSYEPRLLVCVFCDKEAETVDVYGFCSQDCRSGRIRELKALKEETTRSIGLAQQGMSELPVTTSSFKEFRFLLSLDYAVLETVSVELDKLTNLGLNTKSLNISDRLSCGS